MRRTDYNSIGRLDGWLDGGWLVGGWDCLLLRSKPEKVASKCALQQEKKDRAMRTLTSYLDTYTHNIMPQRDGRDSEREREKGPRPRFSPIDGGGRRGGGRRCLAMANQQTDFRALTSRYTGNNLSFSLPADAC